MCRQSLGREQCTYRSGRELRDWLVCLQVRMRVAATSSIYWTWPKSWRISILASKARAELQPAGFARPSSTSQARLQGPSSRANLPHFFIQLTLSCEDLHLVTQAIAHYVADLAGSRYMVPLRIRRYTIRTAGGMQCPLVRLSILRFRAFG